MDIGTGLALSDAGDVVAREHVAESLVEIELGAVSKVVGRLLLKLTFEVRDLFLRGFFLARELGPRLEERLVFRALKELPLLGERGLVPPLGLGNELRSSLRFTGLLFLELRLCRGKFTLRGGDTLCGCFGRALLGVALGLKQISPVLLFEDLLESSFGLSPQATLPLVDIPPNFLVLSLGERAPARGALADHRMFGLDGAT